MTQQDSILAPILAFQERVKAAPAPAVVSDDVSRRAFTLLLAGISALRKTPGLPGPEEAGDAWFLTLPKCAGEERSARTRAHLEEVYGITDRDTLLDFCKSALVVHHQYLDFESFWEDRPNFDLGNLSEGGLSFFTAARDFALPLYPIVGRSGFLGWDISEVIGLLRTGCACGILSEEDFWQLTAYWVDQTDLFQGWEDFALSLLCGHAYWSFMTGSRDQELADAVALYARLADQLLSDQRAWAGRWWYRAPREKEYRLSAAALRPLLRDWEGPDGCLATDRITVDGCPVGYLYREAPMEGRPDSGWRLFAGDESDAYLSDPSHTAVYRLNTLCNYDPEIIPLLKAPVGSAYGRDQEGTFQPEPFTPPEA